MILLEISRVNKVQNADRNEYVEAKLQLALEKAYFAYFKRRDRLEVEHFKDKMSKYFHQRHRLFSRYDEGIRIEDEESWFSVTPEIIAAHIARRVKGVVLDAFCGVGGNSIQFAMTCDKVIAVDIDEKKIEQAKHNARIYGVLEKIEFICADFFAIQEQLKTRQIDAVFLSPPWGGSDYIQSDYYSLNQLLPVDGFTLFQVARCISDKIIYYLPRNTNLQEILALQQPAELEQNFINKKLKTITVYFGT